MNKIKKDCMSSSHFDVCFRPLCVCYENEVMRFGVVRLRVEGGGDDGDRKGEIDKDRSMSDISCALDR